MQNKRFPQALLPWIRRQGLENCTFVEIIRSQRQTVEEPRLPETPLPADLPDPEPGSGMVEEPTLTLCWQEDGLRYFTRQTEPLDRTSGPHGFGTTSLRVCYWLAVPTRETNAPVSTADAR
ncbi:MAG: hypothetical protein SFU56_15410 [Capsulimonadales bacterium]|nr:hypothetical protein [Capsulimonadales bacterium]